MPGFRVLIIFKLSIPPYTMLDKCIYFIFAPKPRRQKNPIALQIHLKIGLFAQNECSNESTALCRPENPRIDNDEKVTSITLVQVTMELVMN